ncbi:MAG: DNRLRE domain-containing protein [Pseudomonadota bacterium]
MKLSAILGAAALSLSMLPMGASAATLDFNVSDDRTIRDSDGNGAGDALLSQIDGFLRTFGTTQFWRSVIEFDLSGLGATVTSATLSLTDQGTSRDGRIDIYGFSGDGIVSVDDADVLAMQVGSIEIVEADGTQQFEIDVTAFLQSLTDVDASHAGFILASESPSFSVGGSDICSSEFSNCAPKLVAEVTEAPEVAPIPLPAGLPLLLAGIGGLALLRRKATR